MTDIITAADHASQQSDRWLFVAILLIGLLGIAVLWRWMVADRDKTAARLGVITDRFIEQSQNFSQVVANNTDALKEVRAVLGNCQNRK